MCVLCGLAQSVRMLSIGYTPTETDVDAIARMNQFIERIADNEVVMTQLERLSVIEQRFSDDNQNQNKKTEYRAAAAREILEYNKIFNK